MNPQIERAQTFVNAALSVLPMVEKNELASLAEVNDKLEQIAAMAALPKALRTQAGRSAKLAEQIVMNETEFESGLAKLSQSLGKMGRSLDEIAQTGAPSDDASVNDQAPPQAPSETVAHCTSASRVPEENRELVATFADRMVGALEEFEAAVLELEKGDSQARNALNRMLHTWKGEFGVLDLRQYSELVHRVEEAVGENTYATEDFFRLKDFLAERISALGRGNIVEISSDDWTRLFGGETAAPVAQATPGMVETPAVGTSFHFEGDPSLVADFITESRDHIHMAESVLLDLESDPTNIEHLNSIFRSCHTIKGVAGFLDLKNVSTLSHSMENLMDMARKGDVALGAVHLDLLFEAMDCLNALIGSVENALYGNEYQVPKTLDAILGRLAAPRSLETAVPVAPVAAAKTDKLGRILVEQGAVSPADVESAAKKQADGDSRKIGEILIDKQNVAPRTVGAALAVQNTGSKMTTVKETVRVPVDRLDQLIDAIGEAVIAQSMVSADPVIRQSRDQELERKISQIDLIMRQIQELSMSLRMVSIKSTFQKMARLVRDLAKKTGKKVNLVMEGEDTELDKTVVENIGDPLMHMIRNAVDHGIEEPQERATSGKPDVATVTLRAFHKGGNVVVEISDDGKGLDRAAILRKAVERGLVREGDNPLDSEVYNFIFMAGFSTAKKVTDVSGRGVGMDVVRKNIQALRGSCEITSEPGEGSTFTIRLPLTLAIINGMVVRLGKERYIVPTLSIIDSLRPKEGQVQTVTGRGEMLNVRGDLMCFVRLNEIFGLNGVVRADTATGIALVVEDMLGKRMGLFVDEILDQQQVVIKNLGDGMGDIPGVTGGAIMSDGSVSLILDVAGIMRLAETGVSTVSPA